MFQTYTYDIREYKFSSGFVDITAEEDPKAAAAGKQKLLTIIPKAALAADLAIVGPQGWELVQVLGDPYNMLTAIFKKAQFAFAASPSVPAQGLYGPFPFGGGPVSVCKCFVVDGRHVDGCPYQDASFVDLAGNPK